jgi:large subunit ribosomal protein L21
LKLYQTFIFLQTQNKTEILYSMYAIVSIAGQQFKVEKGKKVFVHRLPGEVGEEISFDKVLLISQDEKINVGAPYVPDAVVLAQIISHNRGDKVLVFKKKRRKGYQKLNGHRQDFTQILIQDISEDGTAKRPEKKKPVAVAKTEVPVDATLTEVKTKKPAAVKAPAKKPAVKAKAEEKPKKAAVAKKTAESAAKPAAKKAPAKSKGKEKTK